MLSAPTPTPALTAAHLVLLLVLALSCSSSLAAPASQPPLARALHPSRYARVPSCSTTATGWLGRQLRLQELGLSGSMRLFWPDVNASEWLNVNASRTRMQFIGWPY